MPVPMRLNLHSQNFYTLDAFCKKEHIMKEVTLKIPNKKIDFFMELVKQLGFEVYEPYEIPEEHKAIVRERTRKTKENPDRLLDWEEIKNDFKLD